MNDIIFIRILTKKRACNAAIESGNNRENPKNMLANESEVHFTFAGSRIIIIDKCGAGSSLPLVFFEQATYFSTVKKDKVRLFSLSVANLL